jgi:hypothetical protein
MQSSPLPFQLSLASVFPRDYCIRPTSLTHSSPSCLGATAYRATPHHTTPCPGLPYHAMPCHALYPQTHMTRHNLTRHKAARHPRWGRDVPCARLLTRRGGLTRRWRARRDGCFDISDSDGDSGNGSGGGGGGCFVAIVVVAFANEAAVLLLLLSFVRSLARPRHAVARYTSIFFP